MADILIRGMEMSKDYSLWLLIRPDGTVFKIKDNDKLGLPKEGTAIFLPERHGELIERKALNLFPDYKDVRNRIKQTIKATERDGRTTTGVTIDLLKQTLTTLDSLHSVCDAKTIVPAEGDKIE